MAVYEKDFTVEFKDDNSPLTEADRASHEIIRDRLVTLNPLSLCYRKSHLQKK